MNAGSTQLEFKAWDVKIFKTNTQIWYEKLSLMIAWLGSDAAYSNYK